jgi:hypothetical protein
MRGNNFRFKGIGGILAALLVLSLAAGCITDEPKEEGETHHFIPIALARMIDEQLGPIDTSDPFPGPLSHLGNNLQGQVNMDMVLAYLRLVEDTSLKGMAAAEQGAITSLSSAILPSPLEPVSVDNNPCTQDLDNDLNPDYTDLCLVPSEVNCELIGERSFKIIYSDCQWPDPEYKRYWVHLLASTSFLTANSTAITPSAAVTTSTAHWNLNGAIVYHYGIGGVDEQIIEITYQRYRLDLQDFVQANFDEGEDLDNARLMLNGQHLVYQVIQPDGTPAMGTTGLYDGMDIFNVRVEVDDDGEATAQAPGQYDLRLAVDWEDGHVLLQKDKAVLPRLQFQLPTPGELPMPVAGSGNGVHWLLTFYDRDFLWYDDLGTGCQVQVENVDETTRTFDIMDPGLLTYPCWGIEAGTGFEF